jgi:hypothetical protein
MALRAAIFLPRMPDRAFYFGRTAAAIHEYPLPPRFSDETNLHVGVPAGLRRIDAVGIVAHHVRVTATDIEIRRGLPVSSAPRTWCDLAASGLSLGELVAAGDRAIWRRNPLTTRRDLLRCIGRYESRRGSRLMRVAIELLDPAADSAPESEIRVAILEAGLPRPAVNLKIPIPGFGDIHPDLSWPRARVAIEYEGDHHRVGREQWQHDIRRYAALQDAGWWIYRATVVDYRDPHQLLLWLARHLPTDEMKVRS